MRSFIQKYNLTDKVECDSAGTSGYHVGDTPDDRMVAHAKKRGHVLDSLARQFDYEDFLNFDLIVTMDKSNYHGVSRFDLEGQFAEKVIPMANFCKKKKIDGVPDPYYGGSDGFETVMDIVEDGCRGILDHFQLVPYKVEN